MLYTMITTSSPYQRTELHLQTQMTKGREPGGEPGSQTCGSHGAPGSLLEGWKIQCEAQQSDAKQKDNCKIKFCQKQRSWRLRGTTPCPLYNQLLSEKIIDLQGDSCLPQCKGFAQYVVLAVGQHG